MSNRNTRRTSRRRSSAESGLLKNASWFIEPYDQGNGGLKNAVSAALDDEVIENRTWVGTLGIPTDQLSEQARAEIDVKLRDGYDSLVVYCKDADFEGHYAHYCKEVGLPFQFRLAGVKKADTYRRCYGREFHCTAGPE